MEMPDIDSNEPAQERAVPGESAAPVADAHHRAGARRGGRGFAARCDAVDELVWRSALARILLIQSVAFECDVELTRRVRCRSRIPKPGCWSCAPRCC